MMSTPAQGAVGLLLRALRRAFVFGALWLVLTGGDTGSPLLALAAVGAATFTSLWLVPATTVRPDPVGAVRLAAFFVRWSVLGGVDVARRALAPGPPVDPVLVDHRLRLPSSAARTLFVASVSLLPGTLSTEVRDEVLRVHLLDRRLRDQGTLAALEEHVGDAFGSPVTADPEAHADDA
jgi:multicomponent Na+:H+ antiporter subunit E